MKSIRYCLIGLVLALAGCTKYVGRCAHPALGIFPYHSDAAKIMRNGTLRLEFGDGSVTYLTGAQCVIYPVLPEELEQPEPSPEE
jgi:hypothetical protein